MKVDVDEQAQAAFITLLPREIRAGEVSYTRITLPDIHLDFDASGYLIGIEILDLKKLHPELRE